MPPAQAPFHLAGFEPIERLGEGGFGEVWSAMQTNIQRLVAVKFGRHPVTDETVRLRFERECLALGRLSGEQHIMDVVMAGQFDDGRPYLILEYVGGGTLWKLAKQRPLQEAEILQVGAQLAGALDTAHRAGVLHRDVKPENVLLRDNGDAVLGDFGIARLHDSAYTKSQGIAASVAYAAPEILEAKPASAAADIYGLGICLLAAMIRRVPFVEKSDESIQPVIRRVVSERPPDVREYGYSNELALVVEHLLNKDPAKRPVSAAKAKEMLEVLASGGSLIGTASGTEDEIILPENDPAITASNLVLPSTDLGSGPTASSTYSNTSKSWERPEQSNSLGPMLVATLVGVVIVGSLGLFILIQYLNGLPTDPAAGGPTNPASAVATVTHNPTSVLPLKADDLEYQISVLADDETSNAGTGLFCLRTPTVGNHSYAGASLKPLDDQHPIIYQQLVNFESEDAASTYLTDVAETADCEAWTDEVQGVSFKYFLKEVHSNGTRGDSTVEVQFELENTQNGLRSYARATWVQQGTMVYSLSVADTNPDNLAVLDNLLNQSLNNLTWS